MDHIAPRITDWLTKPSQVPRTVNQRICEVVYIRCRCRGLPLLPIQQPEMAHINFHSWFFVSKNAVNKIFKLDRKQVLVTLQWDNDIGWGYSFSCCPIFLGFQANCPSETWVCLYALYETAHASFDSFSFDFFIGDFGAIRKCFQKRLQQDKIFKIKVQLLP